MAARVVPIRNGCVCSRANCKPTRSRSSAIGCFTPKFYGSSLRLSTLAVLLALIVGGTLQGIIGSILVLPLVAAYPIIERIWLKDYLASEVLADHTALAEAAETGSDAAVDAVLQGEKHLGERRDDGTQS